MANNINDGGPAFPIPGYNQPEGMTLRDYFAAKAMATVMREPRICTNGEHIANIAYAMADAMLAARKQGEN